MCVEEELCLWCVHTSLYETFKTQITGVNEKNPFIYDYKHVKTCERGRRRAARLLVQMGISLFTFSHNNVHQKAVCVGFLRPFKEERELIERQFSSIFCILNLIPLLPPGLCSSSCVREHLSFYWRQRYVNGEKWGNSRMEWRQRRGMMKGSGVNAYQCNTKEEPAERRSARLSAGKSSSGSQSRKLMVFSWDRDSRAWRISFQSSYD